MAIESTTVKKRRGFAAMDPELVKELAARGGKAAQRAGTAHRFTTEEAQIAGRKGGMATGLARKKRGETNAQKDAAQRARNDQT